MATSYTARFKEDGLHPKLIITHPTTTINNSTSCSLYAHLHIPPQFIADRFQLSQLHSEGHLGFPFSSSSSSSFPTLQITGERDIEIPISRASSASVFMRLKANERESEIPLHTRYLAPVKERWRGKGKGKERERNDLVEIEMSWPKLVYVCEDGEVPPSETYPCPSSSLPSLPSSPPSTLHFLPPSSSSSRECPPKDLPILSLKVPTGVEGDLVLVQGMNMVLVWMGMGWVLWSVWRKLRKEKKKVA